jgi:hypothetical protein
MKFKIAVHAIIGIIATCACSAFVEAATSCANVTLRVNIVSEATLSTGTTESLNIKAARNPGISAQKNGVGVAASVRDGSTPATLTMVASNDWENGTDAIPSAAVTATTGDTSCYFSPAVPGTRNKASSDTVVGQGCSGSYTETFNLYLAKSWNCATGNHDIVVTYILAAP